MSTAIMARQGTVVGTGHACPICGCGGLDHVKVATCPILACPNCAHQWAALEISPRHVEENYSMDYFAGGGAGYADYLSESEMLRRHGFAYAQLLSRFQPAKGTLLDVGAAAGFLSKGFRDAGWRPTPLEPNPQMAEYGRRSLGLPSVTGSLEDTEFSNQFDAVAMIQVLAHFTNPRAALEAAAQRTKPGGLWLIETWDSQSLVARLLGRHWHEYSPPSALHYFSKSSLATLAAECGFHPVATGRPRKRIGLGHALSLLSHQIGDPKWMKWTKLQSSDLSLSYPGDDVFWAIFRKA